MYFSSEHYASAARRFYQCLSEGGYLVVGPVETSPFFFSCFRPLYYDNVTFYKKDSDYQPNGTKTVYASSERSHVCGLPKKRAKAYPLPAAIYGKTAKENNRRDTGLTYKAIDERTQTSDVIPENKTVQLARIKADEGNFNEALALCDGAVEEDALNPSVYFLKAMILDEMQSRKEAAVFLKKVLYLDPGHILAHFSLGNIFLNDGQITEAKRYYGNTLSLLLSCSDGDILPESDGITAGRLRGIVGTLLAGRTNKE
jgi:chemotaxis protein methyltransferase CheR